MSQKLIDQQPSGGDFGHFELSNNPAELTAWTEIEAGRFMPRRVRGSYLGRVLG